MKSTLAALQRHPKLRLVLAFLAGASTALSFAPYDLWPIYPLALAFGLWQSDKLSPKASFGYWLSFGFGAFAFGISWVHVSMDRFGGLPLIASIGLMALLALYLALYPALAGALLARLAPKRHNWQLLGLFPALWTCANGCGAGCSPAFPGSGAAIAKPRAP